MTYLLLLLLFPQPGDSFTEAEKEWRTQRETSMRSDTSWLSVVGLFWLEEGENTFGTSEDRKIILPPHSTVEKAGSFFVENGRVRYQMARGQRATIDETPQNEGSLAMGKVLAHNHLRMFLIERGGKIALRVRDLRTRNFLNFEALNFYRPKEKYVVEATYEAYEEPQIITIPTVINTEIEMLVPGEISFKLKGKEFTLLPTLETLEDETFFIMFKDETSGVTTYGGGRFLYAERPVDGKITLNFNRAINPPCGYTDFATCPIPPDGNWLETGIEAGERIFESHHDPR